MTFRNVMTRRTCLAALAAVGVPAWARGGRDYAVHHDFVLGTSLDLALTGATRAEASAAEQAVLAEVNRLSSVLNRRDPGSELRQWAEFGGAAGPDLNRLLELYEHWRVRSGGVLDARANSVYDLDALGKAYIVDRALEAARHAAPRADGILLDIGGDVRADGAPWNLGIADPFLPQENAPPLAEVRLENLAMATSGTYARGAHITDARNGVGGGAVAASVVARDCVTANALALVACALPPERGSVWIEQAREAEGLLVAPDRAVFRSAGFPRLETGRVRRVAYAGWPNGYQVTIRLTLTDPAGGGGANGPGGFGRRGKGGFGGARRPYVVIWAEDAEGNVVRTIALWASKPRWIPDLHTWWRKAPNARNSAQMARATRGAGQYSVLWDGRNDRGEPVPPGAYKIWVETNREHGNHYAESVAIECATRPTTAEMKATPDFQNVQVEFGPAAGVV